MWNEDDVIEFGIYNEWAYRKDNSFKKFIKKGYVILKGGHKLEVIPAIIIELKKSFKKRNKPYTLKSKAPIFATKKTRFGMEQRKSINWEWICQ